MVFRFTTKKQLREALEDVDIERQALEDCINIYIERMIADTNLTEKQAKEIAIRDSKIFIKRYDDEDFQG